MLNVLNLALPVVGGVHPNVTVTVMKYSGSTVDEAGRIRASFTESTAAGQFQYQNTMASPQQEMFAGKVTVRMWVKDCLHTVEHQKVADRVKYENRIYNVTSVDNWNPCNGWGAYTLVLDKVASGV